MTNPDTPAGWRLHDAIKASLHGALAVNPKRPDLITVTDAIYTAVTACLAENRPEPLPASTVDLRANIDSVIQQIATTCAETSSVPNLNGSLNRIMNAIGDYTDAIIDRGNEHRAVTVADIVGGPALVYVYTGGGTLAAVDCGPITDNPRERAISRALITEALRHLDSTETSQ